MTRPYDRRIIPSKNDLVTRKVPRKWTPIMRSQSLIVIDENGLSPPIPAQFTTISTCPSAVFAQAAISATLDSTDTSHSVACTEWPDARSLSTRLLALALSSYWQNE